MQTPQPPCIVRSFVAQAYMHAVCQSSSEIRFSIVARIMCGLYTEIQRELRVDVFVVVVVVLLLWS